MDKITFTATDGTATEYFPQAYTDEAVAAAIAALPAAEVAPEATEIDVLLTNGSTKKFIPA